MKRENRKYEKRYKMNGLCGIKEPLLLLILATNAHKYIKNDRRLLQLPQHWSRLLVSGMVPALL